MSDCRCCPITVKKVKIRSLSVEFNEVSWELAPTTVDVLDFTFQVLRSESPEGPWEKLTPQMEDRYIFLDNAIKGFNRHRTYYYVIRVTCKKSEEFWDTEAASLEQDADLVAAELRSHIGLLMREFIGELCWVLPVRTFGNRCSCWSTTLHKQMRSGCKTCWDTTFVRGYMSPIESKISFDPNPKDNEFTTLGRTQQNNTTCRLPFYPPLKPGDIIVQSAEVNRWKVVAVSNTTHVGTPVHQEVQLHMIPQASIEYQIPIELCDDLRNMYLKPRRAFTNPQQMDVVSDEDFSDIFSLYNTMNCQKGRRC